MEKLLEIKNLEFSEYLIKYGTLTLVRQKNLTRIDISKISWYSLYRVGKKSKKIK